VIHLSEPKGTTNPAAPPMPEVQSEAPRQFTHNIVTIPTPKASVVDSYGLRPLKDSKSLKYSDVKSGFANEMARKDARFAISDLARGPLSVTQEEEARVQEEVERRLNAKLQAIREEVKSEAYREGHAAGKELGRMEVLEASKPHLEKLTQLINLFENARGEVFKANEGLILKIIAQIVKAIVLRELKDDSGYTKRLIAALLERIGTRENVKIFVSPQVFSAAEALKSDLAQILGQLKNITIEVEPEIQDLGCRVETDFGEIDADIAIQLEQVERQISGSG
jgi:flagellar assembly protein FliH